MSHMVIYRSSDGKPSYQQIEQLEEAIRFVERLRNEQGVTDAKLFDLVEVPISFKAYYQVEVGGRPVATAEAPPAPPAPPAPEPVVAAPAPPAEPPKPAAAQPVTAAVQPAKASAPAPAAGSASAKPSDDKADAAAANGGGRFGLFGKS